MSEIKITKSRFKDLNCTCRNCQKSFPADDFILLADSNHTTKICKTCASGAYTKCKKCDKFYRASCPCDDEGEYQAWNRIPCYQNLAHRRSRETLGFEIETYNRKRKMTIDDFATLVNKEFGDMFHCKFDGSIKNKQGMEIISNIVDLKWIIKNETALEELFKLIVSSGFVSEIEETCSNHIHFSSKYMTNKNLIEIAKRINSNNKENLNALRILSRRQIQNDFWYVPDKARMVSNAQSFNSNRNTWLSFFHPVTAEFRLFAGCSSLKTLKYNIEIAYAIMSFGEDHGKKKDVPDNLIKYIIKKGQWEHIEERLKNVRHSL